MVLNKPKKKTIIFSIFKYFLYFQIESINWGLQIFDEKYFISGADDKNIIIWDYKSLELKQKIETDECI